MTKPSPALDIHDPCGRMTCGPDWSRTRENSQRLADLELWLVWKGHGWMKNRDREITLLPGFCALMRPGGIYDAWHDEDNPLGIAYIHFDVRAASPAARRAIYQDWPEFFEVDDLDFYNAVTSRIIQMHRSAPEASSALLRGVVLDLLRLPSLFTPDARSAMKQHRARISRLVASFRASPTGLHGVADMARELHMSSAHFSRVFKAVMQQSPRDFLIETRLARARHLLMETNLSVGEIAERLDYADLFFFSRQFKEKTGLSPLQYRHRRDG